MAIITVMAMVCGDRDYRGHRGQRGHMMNNGGHLMDRGYAPNHVCLTVSH